MRAFDGVVCFGGGDWWYHNRGHYDVQMMRRLAERVPVLYVNSLGVRVPRASEGRMFVHRVARKVRSWARGFQWIDSSFAVVSPIGVPGRLGMSLSKHVLTAQVRAGMRRMGIQSPLFWIECPPGIDVAERIGGAGLVLQRTDRYEEFPGARPDVIRDWVDRARARADVVLYAATRLYEEERDACANARFVDHGVDFDAFARGGPEPANLAALPRPRVGFVGGLDEHTFDRELFLRVAGATPELTHVLVGGSTLPEGWCDGLSNVHLRDRIPYEDVPAHMAACDVLVMPWNRNRWIEGCNPVKLKEYLAVGRPIVSTPFPELARYPGLVEVAEDAESFAAAVRRAAADPGDPDARRAAVRGATWDGRARMVLEALGDTGLMPCEESSDIEPGGRRAVSRRPTLRDGAKER